MAMQDITHGSTIRHTAITHGSTIRHTAVTHGSTNLAYVHVREHVSDRTLVLLRKFDLASDVEALAVKDGIALRHRVLREYHCLAEEPAEHGVQGMSPHSIAVHLGRSETCTWKEATACTRNDHCIHAPRPLHE